MEAPSPERQPSYISPEAQEDPNCGLGPAEELPQLVKILILNCRA